MNHNASSTHQEIPTTAIQAFLQDYCCALDDSDIDKWVDFFDEDATYKITTRENLLNGYPIGIMLCVGQGMMRDRVKALKHANVFEEHVYCHVIGPSVINREPTGLLAVRTNFTICRTMYTGKIELFASGKYTDLISMAKEVPHFKERTVVLDSRSIDTLLVYPL